MRHIIGQKKLNIGFSLDDCREFQFLLIPYHLDPPAPVSIIATISRSRCTARGTPTRWYPPNCPYPYLTKVRLCRALTRRASFPYSRQSLPSAFLLRAYLYPQLQKPQSPSSSALNHHHAAGIPAIIYHPGPAPPPAPRPCLHSASSYPSSCRGTLAPDHHSSPSLCFVSAGRRPANTAAATRVQPAC